MEDTGVRIPRVFGGYLGYGPRTGDSLLLIVMYRMAVQISKHSMVCSFTLKNCHIAQDVMDFQVVYSLTEYGTLDSPEQAIKYVLK